MTKDIVSRTDISSAAAVALAQAAVAQAEARAIRVCVVVVDSASRPLALIRMDGVNEHTMDIAADKAFTSASTRRSTQAYFERISASPALALGLATRNRLMVWAGGLPLFRDGACVGAIGISGGTMEEDVACASAAALSLGWAVEAG